MCHSWRRGRASKIRSTNAYACMIIDLRFPLFYKNQTYIKHSATPWNNKSLLDRAKRWEHGVGKTTEKWKFVFHRVIYISPISSTLSAPVAVCSPQPFLPSPPPYTQTHTHISFSHGTGRCTVCIIEIDPVIQLHTTKTAQKSSPQLQPERGHCQGQSWRLAWAWNRRTAHSYKDIFATFL